MKCTIKKVNFFETYDKRVFCDLSGSISLNNNFIPDKIFKWIYSYNGIVADVLDNKIHIKVHSCAKCSENDCYDFNTGCSVAKTKARIKLYTFLKALFKEMVDYYNELANSYDKAYNKYNDAFYQQFSALDMFY